MEPTSSVSPSTIWVTVSVKQAAVPLHVVPVTGGLPPGGLSAELLRGPYEFRSTAVTSRMPSAAARTTADPRGIRLIGTTMGHVRFKDSGGSAAGRGTGSCERTGITRGRIGWLRPESGPGQIWTGDLPVISRTL